MHAAQDTLNLSPPQPPGMVRALGLALLAHALLLVALVINVQWKQTESATVEAELWSSSVQMAAPKAVEVPPPPPPVETPRPTPPPPPVVKVQPPPPAPDVKDADIALERAKKKREAEKLEQALQEKADKAKRDKVEKEKALKAQKAEEKAAEEADKKRAEDKRAKDKKAAQDKQDALDKKAKATQDAKEAAAKEDALKAKAQAADAKTMAAQREANLKKMLASAAGVSGANGAANATGSDKQSSGPSAGYGGKVSAKVKPNIVFPDSFDGNPATEVEVRSSSDGTILSRKVVKPSPNKAWDDAVLKAIDKTETMPRDTDGRVPSVMILTFRPNS